MGSSHNVRLFKECTASSWVHHGCRRMDLPNSICHHDQLHGNALVDVQADLATHSQHIIPLLSAVRLPLLSAKDLESLLAEVQMLLGAHSPWYAEARELVENARRATTASPWSQPRQSEGKPLKHSSQLNCAFVHISCINECTVLRHWPFYVQGSLILPVTCILRILRPGKAGWSLTSLMRERPKTVILWAWKFGPEDGLTTSHRMRVYQ